MNPKDLVALPYRLARLPLALVDFKLVQRLPDDSRARLAFEQAVGSVDRLAGRLLRDDSLARIGSDRIASADKLEQAVGLEDDAAALRRAAAEHGRAAGQKAAARREQAQQRQTAAVTDAVETERSAKQAAAARARAQTTKAKQQAQARADKSVAGIRQELEQTEAAAAARADLAEQAAKAELDNAAKVRDGAGAKRREADTLGALAEAKRAARKSE